jgi:hypothetical protein
MTVTLQDVSVLWGLPIQGVPVGGISDSTDENTINANLVELLGAEPDIRDNGGKSRFHVKKIALRALFANPDIPRSAIMGLHGYVQVMFFLHFVLNISCCL